MIFSQIFLLWQVKQCTIITYKHGKYELPHKLPNDLAKTLEKQTLFVKYYQIWHREKLELVSNILWVIVVVSFSKFVFFNFFEKSEKWSNFSC